jgi:D-arabinose 1-dehydrogenase
MSALKALNELKKEGKILKVGIAGYPLPLLLRLALMAKSQDISLDIIQTFAHHTIQNTSLLDYLPEFEKAGAEVVTNAAVLGMGLLTTLGGPVWHPGRTLADGKLWEATREISTLCQEKGSSLEEVASDFAYGKVVMSNGTEVPAVVGCKSVEEVRRAVRCWIRARNGTVDRALIEECQGIFNKYEVMGLSWQNGADEPEDEYNV